MARTAIRRRVRLPDNAIEMVRELSAAGVSRRSIAAKLGISGNTFDSLLADEAFADLSLAFERGRAEHESMLIQTLLDISQGKVRGNPAGIIFLLKCIHGMLEVSEARRAPSVVINLPAPMDPMKYLEVLQRGAPKELGEEDRDGQS